MSYNAYDKENDEIINLAAGFPTVDAVPTEGSTRPVSSGGVYDSVNRKSTLETVITQITTSSPSTTLSYIGSYTIPAYKKYALCFYTDYNNYPGTGCALATSQTPSDNHWLVKDDGSRSAYICGYTREALTVYVFARWQGSSGVERVTIDGFLS